MYLNPEDANEKNNDQHLNCMEVALHYHLHDNIVQMTVHPALSLKQYYAVNNKQNKIFIDTTNNMI